MIVCGNNYYRPETVAYPLFFQRDTGGEAVTRPNREREPRTDWKCARVWCDCYRSLLSAGPLPLVGSASL